MPPSAANRFLPLPALLWSGFLCGVSAQPAPPAAPPDPPAPAAAATTSPARVTPTPEAAPLPARPESHILDESGMLPEEVRKNLSARLLSSQTRTGLELYLSIHTYLLDETADARARRLHAAWIEGRGAGILVVHDRSTGRLSFAGSDDKRLPDADGLRGLYRLADAAAKSLPAEATGADRLVATLTCLADGLESWQKNGRLPAPVPVAATSPAGSGNASAHNLARFLQPPWPKPESFLVDEASVFTDLEAAASLRRRLDDLNRQHGVQLYVVTVTYPAEGLSVSLAEKLTMEWFDNTMGGVLVFDRSRPETLSMAGTSRVDRWISPVKLKAIHEGAVSAARQAGDKPELRLPAAADYLMTAYVDEGLPLLRESTQWLPRTQRRIFPFVLGGVVGCAALLYLFQRWQERVDRRRRTVFLFPEVFVPERLGAPHGGGVAAESLPATKARPVSANAPTP